MLSVNSIARVLVNVVGSSVNPAVFDTGLLLIKDVSYTDAKRLATVGSAAEATSQLTTWGFTSSTEAYKAAVKYFGASPSPSRLLLSCYPTSQTLPQAINSVLDITDSFYGIVCGQTEVDSRLIDLAVALGALDTPKMLFVPFIGTPSAVVTAGSLLSELHGALAKRAVPFYCSAVSDAAALMGTAMGLELAHKASAFNLCYKPIAGLTPSNLTETEVTNIKTLGGNVYITRGYSHKLIEQGTVASGARYDEILYIDEISADLQNAAITLLADNPDKMPQTDDSTAMFINRFSSILMEYADRQIIHSGIWRGNNIGPLVTGDMVENGFTIWAPSYDEQSDEDRAAHKAVPISIGLVLAGSIESIVININVVM